MVRGHSLRFISHCSFLSFLKSLPCGGKKSCCLSDRLALIYQPWKHLAFMLHKTHQFLTLSLKSGTKRRASSLSLYRVSKFTLIWALCSQRIKTNITENDFLHSIYQQNIHHSIPHTEFWYIFKVLGYYYNFNELIFILWRTEI